MQVSYWSRWVVSFMLRSGVQNFGKVLKRMIQCVVLAVGPLPPASTSRPPNVIYMMNAPDFSLVLRSRALLWTQTGGKHGGGLGTRLHQTNKWATNLIHLIELCVYACLLVNSLLLTTQGDYGNQDCGNWDWKHSPIMALVCIIPSTSGARAVFLNQYHIPFACRNTNTPSYLTDIPFYDWHTHTNMQASYQYHSNHSRWIQDMRCGEAQTRHLKPNINNWVQPNMTQYTILGDETWPTRLPRWIPKDVRNKIYIYFIIRVSVQ